MNQSREKVDKNVLDAIYILLSASTENYEEMKLILLSQTTRSKRSYTFLKLMFALVEDNRPLLIEMKEDVAQT